MFLGLLGRNSTELARPLAWMAFYLRTLLVGSGQNFACLWIPGHNINKQNHFDLYFNKNPDNLLIAPIMLALATLGYETPKSLGMVERLPEANP